MQLTYDAYFPFRHHYLMPGLRNGIRHSSWEYGIDHRRIGLGVVLTPEYNQSRDKTCTGRCGGMCLFFGMWLSCGCRARARACVCVCSVCACACVCVCVCVVCVCVVCACVCARSRVRVSVVYRVLCGYILILFLFYINCVARIKRCR